MTTYDEKYYAVGNNDPGQGPNGWAELVSSMPILTTYTEPRVIFEIDLGTAPSVGEILVMTTRCETTTPYTWPTSIIDALYLSDYSSVPLAGQLNAAKDKGIELIEDLGENAANPNPHHAVPYAMRQWRCNGSEGVTSGHRYLKYIVTSASSGATSGATLQVMPDYGQLDCIRKTPIDVNNPPADLAALIDARIALALAA